MIGNYSVFVVIGIIRVGSIIIFNIIGLILEVVI